MNFEAAIRRLARVPADAVIAGFNAARPGLEQAGALATASRAAALIGQCAHESGGFRHVAESLFYSTPERLMAVWPSRFRTRAAAEPYARNPERLANNVYANRMGNGDEASGDGFRFRGRGYLQLTGRANYAAFGAKVGVDLVANPDSAAEPTTAWLIAGSYLASRKRAGKTALEWADAGNVEMVTRIINGGIIGLDERRSLTAAALDALDSTSLRIQLARGDDGPAVERLQELLTGRGFSLGAIDGDFGEKTERALCNFQSAAGLPVTGRADDQTWEALEQDIA